MPNLVSPLLANTSDHLSAVSFILPASRCFMLNVSKRTSDAVDHLVAAMATATVEAMGLADVTTDTLPAEVDATSATIGHPTDSVIDTTMGRDEIVAELGVTTDTLAAVEEVDETSTNLADHLEVMLAAAMPTQQAIVAMVENVLTIDTLAVDGHH